ncbi:MAG: hypothetical protein ACEQSB_03800 [Undibacterium sp.]
MSLNFSRQTFWAVFVPLTLVAGLFWLSEIRGYRAEMSILVLPKTEFAQGAAANLAALARELPFASAVYENGQTLESPFTGKTAGERMKLWQEVATVATSGRSDLVRISVRATEQDEALLLVKAVAAELVRTGSRYYNQKTDIDIRVIEEPATIPSLTAWPRFLLFTFGTSLAFTFLFFLVHEIIERLFPKKKLSYSGNGEYTISPDTFKPRVPTYWSHDEKSVGTEMPFVAAEEPSRPEIQSEEVEEAVSVIPDDFSNQAADETQYETNVTASPAVFTEEDTETDETDPVEPRVNAENEVENLAHVSVFEPLSTDAEVAQYHYVEHAAAPDNLPVFDGPITPLQGAQARLLKLDIDANAESLAAAEEIEEIDHTPKTHEPTPDEYKRRLNELLSGKM